MLNILLPELVLYGFRIVLAVLLGCLIGIEREKNDKPAGVRTTALVCLGATMFTIINLIIIGSSLLPNDRLDPSRIIAYMIVGIGFLGSGVIIRNKDKLEGATTAICLWNAVAVGVLCGLQKYVLAILITLIIYLVLKLKWIDKRVTKRKAKKRKLR